MGDQHPNAQVVLRGFEAFGEGDMATMKEVMADDVIWHSGGRNKFSGDYQGVDAVLRLFGEVASDAQIEQDLHAILADDDHVVALVNSQATRGDDTIAVQNVFTFHVSNGKITEAWLTSFDDYAADAFWGQ